MENHPCFNKDAVLNSVRIHLPVADECNIRCNYCYRFIGCNTLKCPGATQKILTPSEAENKLRKYSREYSEIAVVGIAGPGDPLASFSKTKKTFEMVRSLLPETILCLSTNGLLITNYIKDILELGIKYVTVTKNAFSPEVADSIYGYINFNNEKNSGIDICSEFLKLQIEGIKELIKNGITVKVNTVLLPGINEKEIRLIAKEVSELKVYTMNIIPWLKIEGSHYDKIGMAEPTHEMVCEARKRASEHMNLMKHCKRCRSDAAGYLD